MPLHSLFLLLLLLLLPPPFLHTPRNNGSCIPLFHLQHLKPLLQQHYTKTHYSTQQHHRHAKTSDLLRFHSKSSPMDHQQSISNQTHVSNTLAAHLLYKKFPDTNVVFSPISIHASLSVLASGSEGPTLDQLLGFLKTKSTDELESLYSKFVPSMLVDGSPNGGPRVYFANGVWVEKTLSLKPSFKQVVDAVYKAACDQVDFKNKAVEAANEVNSWGEKQTYGLIKQVIPADAVNNLTTLILANAVYFKGAWSQKFDQSSTKEADFYLLDGNKVQVPFMTSNNDQFVQAYDDFKVLGLPYSQGQDKRRFTMYIFLPNAKDGLQSLVEKIGSTSDFLERYIPREKVEVSELFIPKFKISFEFESSDMLKELGLVLPFSNVDDFTKIVDLPCGEDLSVSGIHHKSFVEVNEEGTEAAAVSEMRMVLSSRMATSDDKVDFVADHPFLFAIREDETGAMLFMGQVTNPRVH